MRDVTTGPVLAAPAATTFADFYDRTVAKAYRLALLMCVDVDAAEGVLREAYLQAGSRLHEPRMLARSEQTWFLTLVRETALRPD